MVSSETIDELRRRTSVSSLEAMQALSASQGDLERAIEYLHAPRSTTRSLQVSGVDLATGMAAGLVATGLWFECERLDRDKWHFAVAPAGYARLIALHGALLAALAAKNDDAQ